MMEPFREETPNTLNLPRRIRRLGELAYNLWWSWNLDAQRLFSRVDRELWERVYHNPVRFLRQVERARLNAVTHDRYFVEYYNRQMQLFDEYMNPSETWCLTNYPEFHNHHIAYFSTEFGLHEALPIYAGGLGILAGDHLKGASDLGIPLVAVGLLYTHGYFTQHIKEDGWQEARYMRPKFEELPVMPVVTAEGKRATVTVELPGRDVVAKLWAIGVGRVVLFLLDTAAEENSPADRELTTRLYDSDLDLRISQEIILGVGGVRALRQLGHKPDVWHLNEGHSAFLNLERAREMVQAGHKFEEAVERIKATTIFTTHTSMLGRNDEFPIGLIEKYFSNLWPELGLDREGFMNLARHENPWGDTFSMPILALRLSEHSNGVSELHGKVARKMWHFIWPEKQEDDVPITHVTNGVHTSTWLARRLRHLFDRYLGPDWLEYLDEPQIWERVENIPDAELWTVRRHLKRKLVAYMRERARDQLLVADKLISQVAPRGLLLDPYALTVGFAREFTIGSRADLILRDLERLLDIVNHPHTPVQIIFAGKAHPNDKMGKLLIQEVHRATNRADSGGRLAFLEDFDLNLARYIIQGVDVWLNTSRRPWQSSGTSGIKAAMNGVINFSVFNGWWREAYNGHNGWAIGEDRDFDNPYVHDELDAESLYKTLENEIIRLYYRERSSDGLPRDWIARIKESIRTIAPRFSMHRMVKEYCRRLYLPKIE